MNQVIKVAADSLDNAKDTLANSISPLNHLHVDFSRAVEGNSVMITVVGYVVVFLALLLLYLIFANLSKLLSLSIRKKSKKGEDELKDPFDIPGEVTAAIAMALHLHFEEAHDIENTILTIKKVQRPYSPWSSKLYGLREMPNKTRR